MDDLPHPVTTTDVYLARIVQQNDEIIALLEPRPEQPKPRRLKEPATSRQFCREVPEAR